MNLSVMGLTKASPPLWKSFRIARLIFLAPQQNLWVKNDLKHPVFKPLRFEFLPDPPETHRFCRGAQLAPWIQALQQNLWVKMA